MCWLKTNIHLPLEQNKECPQSPYLQYVFLINHYFVHILVLIIIKVDNYFITVFGSVPLWRYKNSGKQFVRKFDGRPFKWRSETAAYYPEAQIHRLGPFAREKFRKTQAQRKRHGKDAMPGPAGRGHSCTVFGTHWSLLQKSSAFFCTIRLTLVHYNIVRYR